MRAQLEKAGSKIKQEAYFDWKLEASRWSTDKLLSLQEVNKKILETVSKLKKAPKTDKCQLPISPSPAAPRSPLLSELPCPDTPYPSLPPPPSVSSMPTDPGEIATRKPEILAAPFRKKLVSGR